MAFKLFKTYLLISFLIIFYSIYLWKNKMPNLYLSHAYFGVQFIFLSLFYKKIFIEKPQKKLVDIIFIIVISILCTQYIIEPEVFFVFNVLEVFLCSIPLVIYAIMHLYNSLSKKGVFMYINTGILIYLSTSSLIYMLGDYLSNFENQIIKNIWFLNKVLFIVYLLFIFMEWYKNIRISKTGITKIKQQ